MRMLKLMRFWYITEKIHFRKSWTQWNCSLYFQTSLLSQPIKKCVPMKLLIIILLQGRSLRFSGYQIAYVFTGKVYLVFNESLSIDIPLTNRVRGPYRNLRTEFFSPRFMAQARINRRGKKRGSVTYSTDRENEVIKIFIISLVCVWGTQERFSFTRNGFKFLTHLESKTSQFKIVFKSLARFNTSSRVKKSFKFLLAIKVKNSWR